MRFREILDLYDTENVRDGYVTTKNRSQELDSATIILTNVEELPIRANDIVEFTNESGVKSYWVVGNKHKKYITFKTPYLYEYTVDLVSPTKFLQIPIPSQTITYRNVSGRSIGNYINRAFNRYFKLDGRYSGINISNSIPTSIEYNNYHAPEATFDKPTLREYIDYLLNFNGWISNLYITKTGDGNTISDYTCNLTYYDLTTSMTPSQIPLPYTIVDCEEQEQGEDYITAIDQEMEKVIVPKAITEHLRLKSDSAVVDEKNAMLYTFHDIYDIKEFYMNINSNASFYIQTYLNKSVTTPGKVVPGGVIRIKLGGMVAPSFHYEPYYCIVSYTADMLTKWESYSDNGTRTWYKFTRLTVNDAWVLAEAYNSQTSDYIVSNYSLLILRNFNSIGSTSGDTTDDYAHIPNGKLDLMPYLQNQSVYDAMELKAAGTTELLAPTSIVKNNSFAWDRGSNKIVNMLSYEQRPGVFGIVQNDAYAIEYALRAASVRYLLNLLQSESLTSYTYMLYDAQDSVTRQYTTSYSAQSNIQNSTIENYTSNYANVKNWVFTITYQGYANLKLRTQKANARHIIPSMDSNTNASTDIVETTHCSKTKLDRQANPTYIFTAYSTAGQTGIILGQRLLGGYVQSMEVRHDNGMLLYKGIITPELAPIFSNDAINKEKRYYSLPDPSEALIRHEVFEKHITGVNSSGTNIKCNYALVYYKKTNNTDGQGHYYYESCILPCTQVMGWNRRVTYTVDLQSNSIYGFKATNTNVYGGKQTQLYKYTDDFGEVSEIGVVFGYRSNVTADDENYGINVVVSPNFSSYFDSTLSQVVLDTNFLKDAREHLVISLDLIVDDADLISDVYNTLEADYSGTYNKYTITT